MLSITQITQLLTKYDRLTRSVRMQLLEHALGKSLGLGFIRQGTLANGAMICDFRWKLSAKTLGWLKVFNTVLQNSYSKQEVFYDYHAR
jgi:hypothetical protein